MYKFKRDKYQKNRGGTSRILDVSCDHCKNHVTFYQKDGPGILKRMYVDRFIDTMPSSRSLTCQTCNRELGTEMIYKKEDRLAYRLFAGAVHKKIIAANKLPEKF
jgi:ribosomal protein S27E